MKVENLVRNYKMVYSDRQDEEEIKVLKGLDFTIEEQEFDGIMGKSGSKQNVPMHACLVYYES